MLLSWANFCRREKSASERNMWGKSGWNFEEYSANQTQTALCLSFVPLLFVQRPPPLVDRHRRAGLNIPYVIGGIYVMVVAVPSEPRGTFYAHLGPLGKMGGYLPTPLTRCLLPSPIYAPNCSARNRNLKTKVPIHKIKDLYICHAHYSNQCVHTKARNYIPNKPLHLRLFGRYTNLSNLPPGVLVKLSVNPTEFVISQPRELNPIKSTQIPKS